MQQNPRHAILDEIIYGPVRSRRFGWSLGINILPIGKKLCNFDCVYCQLGWNNQKNTIKKANFPDHDTVIKKLQNWVLQNHTTPAPDCLTLSGNGEPTLNPYFPKITKTLTVFLKSRLPCTKLILLTNGTQIHKKNILQTFSLFDEVCIKHDPNFQIVNRLQTIHPPVLANLSQLKSLPNLVLQSCLFMGEIENLGLAYRKDWWGPISLLQPKRLDLYTIDETTSPGNIRSIPKAEMQKLGVFLATKNIHVQIIDN